MSATPLTNPEAAQDMHESGMSKEGWKRKTVVIEKEEENHVENEETTSQ